MAEKKAAPVKKGKSYQIWKAYEVKDGKAIRKAGLCPKCEGNLLANHKDRKTCGKCGYMEMKKA